MREITLVVKKGCETCVMIEPVIRQLAAEQTLRVYCQDVADFPNGMDSV